MDWWQFWYQFSHCFDCIWVFWDKPVCNKTDHNIRGLISTAFHLCVAEKLHAKYVKNSTSVLGTLFKGSPKKKNSFITHPQAIWQFLPSKEHKVMSFTLFCDTVKLNEGWSWQANRLKTESFICKNLLVHCGFKSNLHIFKWGSLTRHTGFQLLSCKCRCLPSPLSFHNLSQGNKYFGLFLTQG